MKQSKAGQILSIIFLEVFETTNISIYVKLLKNKMVIKGVLSAQQGFTSCLLLLQ